MSKRVVKDILRGHNRNLAGLISGNFKRHFEAKHKVNIDDLFGELLLVMPVDGCGMCERHQDALRRELKHVGVTR